jgi:hypothetical protein
MIDETPLVAAIPVNQPIIISESLTPDQPLAIAGHEDRDRETLDRLFAQERESQQVANLLGMWTGAMLLTDLVQDHFGVDATESFEEEQKNFPIKDSDR